MDHVDYDAIAHDYDRRYEREDHTGVEQVLRAFAGDRGDHHVLDVACGTGYWLARLSGLGCTELAGIDASLHMLARAQARTSGCDLRHGRAEHLPWPDASFDRVYCINALHHFDDWSGSVAEARRVLRSGGGLLTIGLDPHVGSDRWSVYDCFEGALEADLLRYPPTTDIRSSMAAAGFERASSFVAMRTLQRMPARDALDGGHLDRSATSQLTLLSTEAYDSGITRIWQEIWAAEERGGTFSVITDLSLYATVGWVA
ncbi:MAG TPA: class I SAM-dependent methyltransferase [Euzebyales bacterium]|nr:class I SAM-dependent methyltransferase [Euzebyales bacterium]